MDCPPNGTLCSKENGKGIAKCNHMAESLRQNVECEKPDTQVHLCDSTYGMVRTVKKSLGLKVRTMITWWAGSKLGGGAGGASVCWWGCASWSGNSSTVSSLWEGPLDYNHMIYAQAQHTRGTVDGTQALWEGNSGTTICDSNLFPWTSFLTPRADQHIFSKRFQCCPQERFPARLMRE